jgi:D-galactarolactone cycloisomerase
MQRRDFLKSASLAVLMPQLPSLRAQARSAAPLKITDIRIVRLKVVRETGKIEAAWNPGTIINERIGGNSILEIHTDQGVSGIGPGMDPAMLERAKAQLLGKNPFDLEQMAGPLRYYLGGSPPTISALEIALWDVIGKATGQPVYKLWGAAKDRVPAYASMIQLSTPQERADMAVRLKAEGWKAIKLRAHYQTMKEDVQMVEAVRKAIGDDMDIMVDANQAQSFGSWQPGVMWDFRRALDTAQELQRLNCLWLEEPRLRYSFDELARLSSTVDIPIAGGENNRGVHEYRWILEQHVYGIVQPDIMVADGVTGFREIGAMVQAHHKRLIPHHGGGNLGTIAHLHAIASWPHSPWIEILHDPPAAPYTNGFAIFENPPLVDKEGFLNLPQGPGWGVAIKKDLIVA